MKPERGFDLDRLLERELSRHLGAIQGPSPGPGQARYHAASAGGKPMSLFSSLTASASSKAAVGLAAAALAIGGGVVVAAAAGGGSHPSNWGQTIRQTVQACQAAHPPASGTPKTASTAHDNVGQCVATVARTHGAMERALHAASNAAFNRSGAPTGNGKAEGPPSGVPGGPPAGHPTGKPGHVPPVPTPSHPGKP